jgi:hypothetical protein
MLAAGSACAGESAPASLASSPACQAALEALAAVGDAGRRTGMGSEQDQRTHRAPPPGYEAARLRAAKACLGPGAEGIPSPPRGTTTPPAAPFSALPPPITITPASPPSGTSGIGALLPQQPSTPPSMPRPAQSARPWYILGCDAAGCWANDGTRLPRAGAELIGPRGLCGLQGVLLHCP